MHPSRRDFLAASAVSPMLAATQGKPNVVLIITDDQGYGDLGCHGNSVIRTPNLDRLHAESVRFTDFHVDPLCAPTRSALVTGKYCFRVGVTAAAGGWSILRRGEVTMGDVFRANGYRTGIFGKWHLGDNYPFRPQERGYDESVICRGGGVAQAGDYWGNKYFDDTYWHNGSPQKYTGYCTDVFVSEAIRFVEANRSRPFLLHLATNAPHAPYLVAEKYSKPYLDQGLSPIMAAFYGMITNLDENVARLRMRLAELGLAENTIFIYMTDNGSAAGSGPRVASERWKGHTAGMRGTKGTPYDGGHRVPFFIRWPEGALGKPRDVGRLTAHIDVLPTLIDLAGIKSPKGVRFDGVSVAPLLKDKSGFPASRTHFTQHNQITIDGNYQMDRPQPYRNSAVLTERWRLVNGAELFDREKDPGQTTDIAPENPDIVRKLRGEYERWYSEVSRNWSDPPRIVIGSDQENPTYLTCFDWHAERLPANQEAVKQDPVGNGYWHLEVERAGRYEITVRQRPAAAKGAIKASKARVKIGGFDESKPVPDGATGVGFTADLKAGPARLETWLEGNGVSRGAYYADVRRI